MSFKTFVEQTEKKSRRKLDVGDWVYIEPLIKNYSTATKIAQNRAGQIGRCVERKAYSQSLVYRIRFDDGQEVNVMSSFARKVSKDGYDAFKNGKLDLPTAQQVQKDKNKLSRNELFTQLSKLNLLVYTKSDGYRRCEFKAKYPTQPTFYIEEIIDDRGYVNIKQLLPAEFIYRNGYHVYIRINNLLLHSDEKTSYIIPKSIIYATINLIKKYLKSNYKIGINVPGQNRANVESTFALNEKYKLDSINGDPAVILFDGTHSRTAYFKNGNLHNENGPALLEYGKEYYAINDKLFPNKGEFDAYIKHLHINKELTSRDNAVFDKDFLDEL